jgi:hypothetical protein
MLPAQGLLMSALTVQIAAAGLLQLRTRDSRSTITAIIERRAIRRITDLHTRIAKLRNTTVRDPGVMTTTLIPPAEERRRLLLTRPHLAAAIAVERVPVQMEEPEVGIKNQN